MQCRDGGWGAFDVDNTRTLCRELPFCDFGELIDPPSADVTAHVVEMLAEARSRRGSRSQRGVEWLLGAQEPDGSWFGRWGVNHLYGTGAVVPALVAAGLATDHPAVRRAVAWLEGHQNPDGGWGEDLRSYGDARLHGPRDVYGVPDGLGPAGAPGRGRATRVRLERGVEFLVATQCEDGSWDEPWFTGNRIPGRLLHQLSPLPPRVPCGGAGALS